MVSCMSYHFCHENVVCLSSLLHIYSKAQTNTSTLEANTMNPDQTAPKGAGSMMFAI